MAQIFDARGNEWQNAIDAINGITLTDARTSTNTLNSLNASVSVDIVGKATMMVHLNVTVAFNAATTLQIQGTLDGTNFFVIPHMVVQNSNAAPTINIPESIQTTVPGSTLTGQYLLEVATAGFRQIRVIMNAFTTAGTAVVALRATASDYRIIAQPYPSLLFASGDVTSGTIVTLATPPAGMFQYITSVYFAHYVTAAVTAAAAVTINVANAYGAGAAAARFAVPNTGAIGAYTQIVSNSYPNPLKATAAATTVTFALSGALAATGRCIGTVGYYFGA